MIAWVRQGFTVLSPQGGASPGLTTFVRPGQPEVRFTERETATLGVWWWAEMGAHDGRPDVPAGAVCVDEDPARPGVWRAVFGTPDGAPAAEEERAAAALLAYLNTRGASYSAV